MQITLRRAACACFFLVSARLSSEDFLIHSWKRIELSDGFYAEGATFGDLNKDGKADVVAGPYWYEGPDFAKRHEYYPAKPFDKNGYSDNFFAWVRDFNADGWNDILIIGFPGKDASWYQNPQGAEGSWKRHVVVESGLDNESPTYTDLNGDGREEIVFHWKGQFGWAGPDVNVPGGTAKPWPFHAVAPKGEYGAFTHGMGVGDVNSDGRMDILERTGWWEQPPAGSKAELWTKHPFDFAPGG